MTFVTPVDAERSMFFSTIAHSREPGDRGKVAKGIAKRMTEAQHVQIRHDFHIWQNMRYRVKPIFTGEDERTRYAFLRRHFDRFYPNPVYAENQAAP
jgi:hypothetical protein